MVAPTPSRSRSWPGDPVPHPRAPLSAAAAKMATPQGLHRGEIAAGRAEGAWGCVLPAGLALQGPEASGLAWPWAAPAQASAAACPASASVLLNCPPEVMSLMAAHPEVMSINLVCRHNFAPPLNSRG